MNQYTTKFIAACTCGMGATVVFAHDGHGLSGTHWHATDVWGFVAVAAMLAVAIWLSRK
ncbi:MAG: hypothetical protein WBK51_12525 [Polaromonas sp.]